MGEILEQAKKKVMAIREKAISGSQATREEAADEAPITSEMESGEPAPSKMTLAKEKVVSMWKLAYDRSSAMFAKLHPRERLFVIFAIGIVLGFGMKTIAHERLTIGYQDYTLSNQKAYDLIVLQKKVAEKSGQATFSGAATGGSCQ